ncbi:Homeobox protein YOX1 [Smittium culicis]|uniref:Homeobox protein YOX1 n=1 Tax=Smittium culicis TaxID=133412 RepID=A0A1R1XTQ6_9FUNG|nr:Homeobox protein YOX1 [Smittium culicis]
MSNIPIWQRRSDKRSVPFNPHLNLSKTVFYPNHGINTNKLISEARSNNNLPTPPHTSFNSHTQFTPSYTGAKVHSGLLSARYPSNTVHERDNIPLDPASKDHQNSINRFNSPTRHSFYEPYSANPRKYLNVGSPGYFREKVSSPYKYCDQESYSHPYKVPFYHANPSNLPRNPSSSHYYYHQPQFLRHQPHSKNFLNSNSKPSYSFFYMQQRRRHTKEEIETLEQAFKINPMPSKEEKIELSYKTNMEIKHISIWFQNKRQAVKKKKLENTSMSPELQNNDEEIISQKPSFISRKSNAFDIKNLINPDLSHASTNNYSKLDRLSNLYDSSNNNSTKPYSATIESKFSSLINDSIKQSKINKLSSYKYNIPGSAGIPSNYHSTLYSNSKHLPNISTITDPGNNNDCQLTSVSDPQERNRFEFTENKKSNPPTDFRSRYPKLASPSPSPRCKNQDFYQQKNIDNYHFYQDNNLASRRSSQDEYSPLETATYNKIDTNGDLDYDMDPVSNKNYKSYDYFESSPRTVDGQKSSFFSNDTQDEYRDSNNRIDVVKSDSKKITTPIRGSFDCLKPSPRRVKKLKDLLINESYNYAPNDLINSDSYSSRNQPETSSHKYVDYNKSSSESIIINSAKSSPKYNNSYPIISQRTTLVRSESP